jgi:molybdenum-dependent DNA-binding transcriptional regulator ModE
MPDTARLSPLVARQRGQPFGELEVLVLVAEQGSLSAAARLLGCRLRRSARPCRG